MDSGQAVEIPPGQSITVKLINPVNFGSAEINRFMAPHVPGLEYFRWNPSLCFLLEHPSGRKLVWDLGIRKDYHNYSRYIAEYIPTKYDNIDCPKSVGDILQEGGYSLDSIEAVIWSHWHWDHIGNPAEFPASTALVVGPGFKEALLPGAPANPDSQILESDYANRELREISFSDFRIGEFPAFDYFGDGSFYLLDTPGHAIGHLCGLARTTSNPDSFVLLGGDVCHYAGVLRPSDRLPLPSEVKPNPWGHHLPPLCPGHAFEELQTSRGRKKDQTLYDPTFGHDIPLATRTVKKLQGLDCREDVFVVIAHDAVVRDTVDHFPKDLNTWRANGWGDTARWGWLKDLESWFSEKGIV